MGGASLVSRYSKMISWEDALAAEPIDGRRKVADMCCDIEVYRQCRSLILIPGREVRGLTSGNQISGYSRPGTIVNTTSMGNRVEMSIMGRPLTVNDRMTAQSLCKMGIDPETAMTFGTAAHMDNAAVENTVASSGVRVSVAATGGVRGNGGRAGDPASFDEASREQSWKKGTIVLIVAVEARLSDAQLLDVMLAATQAKSCVLQELMARSLYSHGVATGSGTDQVGVVCDANSRILVDSAGSGSPLGIAVSGCVRAALYRTLDMQSGMTHAAQCDPYVSLSRFGIAEGTVHDELRCPSRMSDLLEADRMLHADQYSAAIVSSALRLQDEVDLGNMCQKAALESAMAIIEGALLREGDIDPATRVVMENVETVPELVSVALACLLRRLAKEVAS